MYYKYRNTSEWTEKIIIEKEIWLAKPETLNDPFECNPTEFLERDSELFKKNIMKSQIAGFIHHALNCHKNMQNFYDAKGREIKILLNRIKKQKGNIERQYRIINDFLEIKEATKLTSPSSQLNSQKKMLENLGVFSVSEDPLNSLMWAHYANNHTGIVLGFDIQDFENSCFKKVNYIEVLPEIDLSKGLMNGINYYLVQGKMIAEPFIQMEDPQIQNIIFTKTIEWQYEKEWRFITKQFGKHLFPGKLKQLIFGMKCPESEIIKYIRICDEYYMDTIQFFIVQRCNKTKGKMVLKQISQDQLYSKA